MAIGHTTYQKHEPVAGGFRATYARAADGINWDGVIKDGRGKEVWRCGHHHHNRDMSTSRCVVPACSCSGMVLNAATNPDVVRKALAYAGSPARSEMEEATRRDKRQHAAWALEEGLRLRARLGLDAAQPAAEEPQATA